MNVVLRIVKEMRSIFVIVNLSIMILKQDPMVAVNIGEKIQSTDLKGLSSNFV